MKKLKDCIKDNKLPRITNNSFYNSFYVRKQSKENTPITQLNNGHILDDFYEFLNYNNITNITEDTYSFYFNSVFNHMYYYMLEDSFYTYNKYQNYIYSFETLNQSWDSHVLVDKLDKLVSIKDVRYVNPKRKTTQFQVSYNSYNDIDKLLNDKKFWSLIHLYNYYIKTIIDDTNSIILEPYKPKDITNKIYDDLYGILYHITQKINYKSGIKYKELAPKWKGEWDKLANKPYDIWRDGRIFFIGNNNDREIQKQLKSIRNTADKNHTKEWVVLKIDLNKYKNICGNKIRFRIDSSALGYNSYFTEEPIPDFCITPIDLDTWKEIDKKLV